MAKNIHVKDRSVRVQIWDTAGQEAFRSITRSYYKSSTCAFIVYDITNKSSFKSVASWLNECREMCYKDILICLVGNKTDLENKRIVSKEEGQKFAEDNGLLFFETSAQDGTNIEELFTEATSNIVNKVDDVKKCINKVLEKEKRLVPDKEKDVKIWGNLLSVPTHSDTSFIIPDISAFSRVFSLLAKRKWNERFLVVFSD